jgi:hypothetical protein
MRLYPIGAQPIDFDTSPLAVSCADGETPLLMAEDDSIIFQLGIGCCTETPLIDEPDFRTGWVTSGRWSVNKGSASSNDWQDGASIEWPSFTPVVGEVYCLAITFSDLSGQGVEVSVGGLSWDVSGTGEWSVTFTAQGTDVLNIRLNSNAGSSVAMTFAQVYEGPSEIGVQLLSCENEEYPLFSTTLEDTPQYFRIENGVLMVDIPMPQTGIEDGCFKVNAYLTCGEETEGITASTILKAGDEECRNTLKLRVCNDTDKMGVAAGYFEMRIRSSLVRPKWNVELREHTQTDGRIVRDFASRTTVWELYVEPVGYGHHQFLSSLAMWDHLYLQGVEWAAQGGEYAPDYASRTTVGGALIELRPRVELLRAEQCGPLGAGCDPANDPICNTPNASIEAAWVGAQVFVNVLVLSDLGFPIGGIRWSRNGTNQTPITYTGPGSYQLGPLTPGDVIVVTLPNTEDALCDFTFEAITVPCRSVVTFDMSAPVLDENEMRILTSSTFFSPLLAASWAVLTPAGIYAETNGGSTSDYITVYPNEDGRFCFAPSLAPALIQPNTDFTYLEFIGPGFITLDLSGCDGMAIRHLVLANVPNLNSVVLPTITASLLYLDLSGIGLTTAQVDALLCALDGFETTGGTVILDGGNNAAPSTAGQACATALLGKSWTVSVN